MVSVITLKDFEPLDCRVIELPITLLYPRTKIFIKNEKSNSVLNRKLYSGSIMYTVICTADLFKLLGSNRFICHGNEATRRYPVVKDL